ncbi:DsbE family thiol:disulfide interchange protein [Thalassobius sp. S69A]|uniref:DsbE family thiol:disulfide interchange protein n=1 Tax=unclassified Thalassovita TaxID=2619711 RepID=UPI000C5A9D7B|nr:DsbE family thiol:disulfide interchange protein [Paracoccaceae bacterium]
MAKFSPLMVAPPLIFAGLAAMFVLGMNRENPDVLPSQLIDKQAPALTLTAFEGTPLLTDEVVRQPGLKLVNFWGTWCVACRAEHPMLLRIEDLLPVTLHGVNFDETIEGAPEKYLAEEGNPFTTLGKDLSKATKIDWGVYGAPETFLIDKDGNVLLRIAGPLTQRVMESTLVPAVQKALAAETEQGGS